MANKPVNGVAAANTMLGFGTWRPGHCLEAVWTAYSRNGAQDITGQREPTAYDAWLHTDAEDRRTGWAYKDIPAGVPVWFGPKSGSRAGDVVISVGGGFCVATDIPGRPGVIGRMKIEDRQRQIRRPYLGWSTTILDWPISFASGGGSTPTPKFDFKKDEDMDFINIQGKAGEYHGGQFAIYRGNADGKLYARRLTKDTMNPALPTFDNEAMVALQKAMPFIDLVGV